MTSELAQLVDAAYVRMVLDHPISSSTVYDLAAYIILSTELYCGRRSRAKLHKTMRSHMLNLLEQPERDSLVGEFFVNVFGSEQGHGNALRQVNKYSFPLCRPRTS